MFSDFKCRFTPRKYQQEILDLLREKRRQGERRFHLVAPPGSGKTILGLQLIVDFARPAIVLAPNSGIQIQWVDKLRFFAPPGAEGRLSEFISGDPSEFRPIMALTYQSLTTRSLADAGPQSPAEVRWTQQLIEDGEVESEEDAAAFLDRLRRANPALFARRRSLHERVLLAEVTDPEETLKYLHPNARALIEKLAQEGVGTVVLDECHHLTGYWAQVAQAIVSRLEDPVVVGLTATPPDEAEGDEEDGNHYLRLIGEIDYRVPTPAVIREGNLAPFQDLVYFCRPTPEELAFVANADAEINAAWEELEAPPNRLAKWVQRELMLRPTPSGKEQDWKTYIERRRTFCAVSRDYLKEVGLLAPVEIHSVLPGRKIAPGEGRMILLERVINRGLLVSDDEADHALAKRIRDAARMAGYEITGRGLRGCQSPVSRVLARSRAKAEALVPILAAEKENLGDALRAVIITDFERSSATHSDGTGDLIDAESGGAVQAFRVLTSHDETDDLDPILVTGQTVLVDDDLLEKFMETTRAWLAERGLQAELETREAEGFYEVLGRGPDWSTRTYVLMMTEFLTGGVTRCLVGTRGLLGEGWDCPSVNVLVDLTTATTSMTVQQLRGRSIRLDPDNPRKVANNWDVVCMAPEFQRGLGDYERFAKKHAQFHSLTDDGHIEKGVHHVHPALRGAKPEEVALTTHVFNSEMERRSSGRESVYDQWGVGQPYRNEEVATTQVGMPGGPPACVAPGEEALMSDQEAIRQIAYALLEALCACGEIKSSKSHVVVKERSGGYCRAFLENAEKEDMAAFARAMAEVFSPLEQQRYMAPRFVPLKEHSWLSRLLPGWMGRYFRRKGQRLEMYHPVPEALGASRQRANIFQNFWNQFVSPGEVLYTRSGKGKDVLLRHRGPNDFGAERMDVWR